VNDVNESKNDCQDAEADGQRYSGVREYVDAFLRVYTYTEHHIASHKRCYNILDRNFAKVISHMHTVSKKTTLILHTTTMTYIKGF